MNDSSIIGQLYQRKIAVFISYTGRTKAIVENAALAAKSGARTIGLTRSGTPLVEHCRVVVNAVTAEDTDLFTPMTSRIIHLALVDILATKMALQLGDEVEKNIKAIKTNLQITRSI